MIADITETPGVVPQKKGAANAMEARATMSIKITPAVLMLSGEYRGDRIFLCQPDTRRYVQRPDLKGRMVGPALNLIPFRCGERTQSRRQLLR